VASIACKIQAVVGKAIRVDIRELRQHWESWGNTDPFWAILSIPENRGGMSDRNKFLLSGTKWVAGLFKRLDRLGVDVGRERALDFGCGVGRLTQALGAEFEECYGVDIAESMIALANELNTNGSRCRYFVNRAADLRLFEDRQFDLVNAWIVLQHMRPAYTKHYIAEFMRVLKPGGVLFFQLPADLIVPAAEKNDSHNTALLAPLPDWACSAQVSMLNCAPELAAGSQLVLRTRVRNTSSTTWPAAGNARGHNQIKLGSRWLGSDGSLYSDDGTRTLFSADLPPQSELELPMLITAPTKPGNYILQADIVQEIDSWFADKGSRPDSSIVRVTSRDHSSAADASGQFTPEIQMHGVPRPTVISLIRQCGGDIVEVRNDRAAGEHFDSYSYIAVKRDGGNGVTGLSSRSSGAQDLLSLSPVR
jgi:SAM-dependent methyltransferase